ncbi:uncharacterized protein LOC128395008 [Panonychus citri]|uniref:uncharacterized protein LOC128395008 n=1 Tax=Panonychus citri TaxID=50023 RepID=UPI00230728A4|nr:uncharacterized protein LOC128395008 [Panonychus citri]
MLDLFGSVFGRSRRSGQSSGSSKTEGLDDGSNKDSSNKPIYPSISGNNQLDSPYLPRPTTASTLERQLSSNYSPIDGIPFVINPNIQSTNQSNSTRIALETCFEKIDQIGIFLASPSQSNYNMETEKLILDQYR